MKILLNLIFLAISTITLSSCRAIFALYEYQKNYPTPLHFLESNNEFEAIWKISDINMDQNKGSLDIVGAPGKIIINGWKNGNFPTNTIIGLDSISGNIAWTILAAADGGEIITQGENLYRGTNGTATVVSYNIENGELLWDTRLPWAHSTSNLYFAEDKIFVHTSDGEFFILNEEGKILDTFHESFGTFLVIDDILYMEDNYSIKAVDYSSKKELWRLEMDSDYTAPIFDDETIFLSTSLSIYSINQSTGKVNWKVTQDILSNLYLASEKIYFIDSGSNLVVIDQYSGNEILKLQFSPAFDLNKQNGEYHVSGDPTNDVLVVSFGDNHQIMGLNIINP